MLRQLLEQAVRPVRRQQPVRRRNPESRRPPPPRSPSTSTRSSSPRPTTPTPSVRCPARTRSRCASTRHPPSGTARVSMSTVGGARSVAGHFATGDQRHLVLIGTDNGSVHEVFWKAAQVGIEGEDDLPVPFDPGTIADVASMYNTDEQRHIALVGTSGGPPRDLLEVRHRRRRRHRPPARRLRPKRHRRRLGSLRHRPATVRRGGGHPCGTGARDLLEVRHRGYRGHRRAARGLRSGRHRRRLLVLQHRRATQRGRGRPQQRPAS